MADRDETTARRRRSRNSEPRNNRVTVKFLRPRVPADRRGAQAAETAIATYVARQYSKAVGTESKQADPELIRELLAVRHSLCRIAAALHQSAAAMAETRQPPGDLAAHAAYAREVAERVDDAITQMLPAPRQRRPPQTPPE